MVLAGNQKEIAEELEREGVVVNLGWHEDVTEMDIRDAVQNLLADSDKRRSMGLKEMMVDRNGLREL
jgi:spore coat polysaccharide biosynthesis predicted glycosyltransferase SpsG